MATPPAPVNGQCPEPYTYVAAADACALSPEGAARKRRQQRQKLSRAWQEGKWYAVGSVALLVAGAILVPLIIRRG